MFDHSRLIKIIPSVLAVPTSLLMLASPTSEAACSLIPAAGDTDYTCDSGSSGPLTDTTGNNTLTLPANGTGTINGNVTFGAGADKVVMDSGTLNGALDMGDGANVLQISAGQITGAVSQGINIDNFIMTGGQILSLAQGNGRDNFLMTGGTIVGAFVDGDVAKMTGGTIGRVDMKLDNNIFDMSGGTIIGNLVTGLGQDTIIVSGTSFIGGNISTSAGVDNITVSGGVIAGEIRASTDNDTFTWINGGQIKSAVLMGDGDDTALLSGLNESLLGATPSIDGGLGNDRLTFDNTTSGVPGRYLGWESVNLTNNSHFDLAGDFFLGDSVSNTGVFSIDGSSTLAVTQGSIRPYTAGQLATLNNAGVIDMTTGSGSAADSLTVHGNYVGNNGQLRLQTVLGDDSSASDKLVVSQGSISGSTQLGITNLGGAGGLTRQSGIEVVEAQNGATSTQSAFSLRNSVSAGAYEYYLFKGGVTAGTENNWYLRSSVVAVPPLTVPPVVTPPPVIPPAPPPIPQPAPVVDPDEPLVEPPTARPVAPVDPVDPVSSQTAQVSPTPAASTPPIPNAVAGADPIPLYRLEVPVYSVVIPAAQMMTLQALGTFHDRQGEQSLLTETGNVPAGWGRVYGSNVRKSWTGTVSPSFDGSLQGFQIGHDLYASTTDGGQLQRLGFFVGHSDLRGDVDGFAEGFQDRRSGRVKLDGDHVGAYWTLVDPSAWYVDAVAMWSRLEGDSRSERGVKMNTDGHALALSLEAGYPIAVSSNWVVEPQAQVINQHISLNNQNDGISDVSFDSQDYWTGRLGARLKGRYQVQDVPLEPYLRANLWRTFGGYDTVTYDDVDRIKSEHTSSSADVGAGLVAKLSSSVSVYASADYSTNLDSNALNGVSGSVGLRMSW